MKSSEPKFSVLMTAYNRAHFIEEAIRSILNQTYVNWELIIVDDHSLDETVSVARKFQASDNRISLYVNEYNLGDYANRNKAASYASGEYIMYVDSDDYVYPDALAYVKSCFDRYPEAKFATLYEDKSSELNREKCFLLSSSEVIHQHFFKNSLLHFGPGGTVVRNTFFREINGFPETFGPANDMFYNVKAAIGTPVIMMRYNYLYYRDHPGQEVKNRFAYIHYGYTYFNEILKMRFLPLTHSEIDFLCKKNKRRFVINLLKYSFKEWKWKKSI